MKYKTPRMPLADTALSEENLHFYYVNGVGDPCLPSDHLYMRREFLRVSDQWSVGPFRTLIYGRENLTYSFPIYPFTHLFLREGNLPTYRLYYCETIECTISNGIFTSQGYSSGECS